MIVLDPAKIKYLITHNTGTSRDYTTFKSVKKYHTSWVYQSNIVTEARAKRLIAQGKRVRSPYGDIAYHWFVVGKGKLYKGRDEKWVGAHSKSPGYSMNFQSLGIALTGNGEKENPSKAQIKTWEELVDRLRKKYNIPKENVLGHKEVLGVATLCPGKNFMPFIKTYRQRKESPREEPKSREEIKKEIIKLVNQL